MADSPTLEEIAWGFRDWREQLEPILTLRRLTNASHLLDLGLHRMLAREYLRDKILAGMWR